MGASELPKCPGAANREALPAHGEALRSGWQDCCNKTWSVQPTAASSKQCSHHSRSKSLSTQNHCLGHMDQKVPGCGCRVAKCFDCPVGPATFMCPTPCGQPPSALPFRLTPAVLQMQQPAEPTNAGHSIRWKRACPNRGSQNCGKTNSSI